MKKRMYILLTLAGLFISTTVFYAQKPNYSGVWVLNLEKSTLQYPKKDFKSSIFDIKQEGDKFKLTIYQIYEKKKRKIKFKMVADGKTRKVKLIFKGKLEWEGNNLISSLWRKNYSNIVTYKYGNTENEFIADEIFKGRPQDHHNIWVFDRKP